ncbi:hypothetical protein HYZ70_02690 [Candidatus Curtissbacteria bacterium]|nr:hypothetical protein [Candidatus Curtissbacteria bacterium]
MNWFNPSMLPWWGWLLAGAILWFFVNNFFLPDSWSKWIGERKNGPVVLLPFGFVAFLAGGFNVLVGVGWAVLQALGHFVARLAEVKFEPWVAMAVGGGLVIVLFYRATQSWRKKPKEV